MLVNSVSGSTLSVVRGYNATTLAAGSSGDSVYLYLDQAGNHIAGTPPDVGALQHAGVAPATPTVTSVNPNSGTGYGGTTITVTGTNLQNATSVNVGIVHARIVSDTGTTITAVTGYSPATATVDTTVTTVGWDTSAPNPPSDQFTYNFTPATYSSYLDGSGNLTIAMEIPSNNAALSFSLSAGHYTVTDTNGLVFDLPGGVNGSDITGYGTSTITVPSSDVTSISVTLGTGTNTFTITGTNGAPAAPLSVNAGSTAGDQVHVTGNTQDSEAISLTSNAITESAAVTVTSASISLSASSIALSGASVTTTGTQTYNGSTTTTISANLTSGGNLILNDSGTTTITGNINLGSTGNLVDQDSGQTTISGLITGEAAVGATVPVPGLIGTYFQIGQGGDQQDNPGSIQPPSISNPAWIGNRIPTATVLQTGPVDFPNISSNGFQDINGHTYYNFGNNNNSTEARWYGEILIPGTGTNPVPVNFLTGSDDGSMLYIDGSPVVYNDTYQGFTTQTGLTELTPGLHAIDIEWFNGGGGARMLAQWDPTGGNNFVDIPGSVFFNLVPANSVFKTGSDTLTLSHTNTYNGETSIGAGTLVATTNGAMGSASAAGVVVESGGALALSGGVNYSTGESVSISGSGPAGNGAIENISGSNSFAGAVTLSGSATIGADAGSLTLSGGGSLGAYNLTVAGTGATTIGGALTSDGGTLTGDASTATTISADVSTPGIYGLTLAGTGAVNVTGNIDLGATGNLTVTASANDTISGVISGEASSATTAGLYGTYFQINNNGGNPLTSYIAPASVTNPQWLGNQTPTVVYGEGDGNVLLNAGPIDFPNNINSQGFTDINGHTYWNFGGNNDAVEARWYGDITIPGTGTTPVPIGFQTTSDDGSTMYIDGTQVVNNNFFQGMTTRGSTVDLTPGLHAIDIEYYNGGGGAGMIAQWNPGSGFVDIPQSVLSIPTNTVNQNGTGTLTLTGNNTYLGTTTVTAGNLQDNGTIGAVNVKGGVLGGSGTAGTVNDSGTVKPGLGSATSILNTGNLSFGSGGVYSVALNGTTAGTQYDQLNVTGSINLTGAILTGTLGYSAAVGDTYTIIHNVDNTPVTGVFSAVASNNTVFQLPQGAVFNIGSDQFQISYTGGAGNDVTLTRVLVPAYGESLDASGNLVIFQEIAAANDNLTFSSAGGVYTFTDPNLLFDVPTGAGAGSISGGGTHTITVNSTAVTSITVGPLGVGTNVFTIGSTSGTIAPLTANTGALAGDQLNITAPLTDSGAVSLTSNSITDGASDSLTTGSLTLASSGVSTISGNINLGTAGNLFDVGPGADTISGVISGTGSDVWRETAAGTLTLSNTNTYTGTTNVSDGTLVVTANGAMGPAGAAGVFVTSGGALAFSGGVAYSDAESTSIAGSGPAGHGAIENISGVNSFAGNITLTGNATIGSDAGSLTLSGNVNLGATGNLTATGAGQTTISGLISGGASSGSVLEQGLVGTYFNVGASQALIQPAAPSNPAWLGNLTPASTSVLVGPIDFQDINDTGASTGFTDPYGNSYYDLNPTPGAGDNNNVEARWYGDILIPGTGSTPVPISFGLASDDGSMLYIDGTAVVNNNHFQGSPGYPGLQVTNTVDLVPGLHAIDVEYYNGGGGASVWAQWDPTGGSSFVDIPNSAFYYPVAVNSVTKTGTGTLTLSHTNTYVGATTINAGTLVATANGAMGPATDPGITVKSGGALAFSGGVNYSTAEPTTIAGTGPAGNGAIENLSGANTFAGPITIPGSATIGSDAGTLTLSGTINMTSPGGNNLTVTGAGQTTVTGVISGEPAGNGLVGQYFQIGNGSGQQAYIQPANASNAAWLGNQTPADTAPLVGSIYFPNISGNGFEDNNGITYYNFGNNNNSVEARWYGDIMIPGTGTTPVPISFATGSDDGSMMYIDGNAVVSNNTYQGVGAYPSYEASSTLSLTPGLHTIDVEYYNGGGGAAMWALWDPTGGTNFTAIPNSAFFLPVNGLIKSGTGTLTLSNTNTYHGATTINGGTLDATANGAMGPATNPGITVNSGGALAFSGGVDYATAEPTFINGTGPAGNGAIENISGANIFSGPITLQANATIGSDAGNLSLNAPVLNLADYNLTSTGSGNTVISSSIQHAQSDYVGFTGATGGATSLQSIVSWTYTSGATNIDYSGGFATNNLSINGGAYVNGTQLQLTNGGGGEATSAWTPTPVSSGGFSTTFQWTYAGTPADSGQADGFTFALQGAGNSVIGAAGGGLGYQGIAGTSLALEFNQYAGSGSGSGSDFGIGIDGAISHNINLVPSGVDFSSNPNDVFQATATYDGNYVLTVSIWDTTLNPTTNPANFTETFNLAPTAYAGFTGGTGGLNSVQNILNWNYTSGATNINYSSGFATSNLTLNGGASINGTSLELTDGFNNESRTAWTPTTVPTSAFNTNFQWSYAGTNEGNGPADGFTFALQDNSNTIIGAGGGGLGYQGIGNSLSLQFNQYTGSGTGSGSDFGLGLNGVISHNINMLPYGINFHNNVDVFEASAVDNGFGVLTVDIWDATANPTGNPAGPDYYSTTFAIPVDNVQNNLTKTGTGTTILSNTNTYTGATAVNGGTLQVDGSIAASSGVTVAAGATLSGLGTVSGTTVSGTLKPGDPGQAGTLSTDLTFNAGSTLQINENTVASSVVVSMVSVTGSASLTGASLSVAFADIVPANSSYTILQTTGGLGGTTFNGLPNNSDVVDTINGQTFEVTYTADDVILTKVGSAPAPTITSVVINENISSLYNAAGQPSPGTQRSMVNDIVYTFSEAVNIVGPGTNPNVFTIAIAAGWTGTLPTLSWAPVSGSGNTEWAVTFTGASVTAGSIATGAYTITVNDPADITAVSDNQDLSLAGSGIGSATQSFYRLFGDINGDEFVNAADNLHFKPALATYNAAFDFNGDGVVNAADNLKFKNDLTVNFSGFTPTI